MVVLDGSGLASADIVAIASGRAAAEPGDPDRARRSHQFAAEVSAVRPVYGRSTGVGANRNVAVADPTGHALALLRSHATSAGSPRSPERVRAMLAVRLNQLAVGGSGADPRLLAALGDLLAADARPDVREYGGIGTGDLAPLALTALALLGEAPTAHPSPGRIAFGAEDALAFISSNAATIADAALAQDALARLARAALGVAALTFTAVDGNDEAFSAPVEQVTPFPGARVVCRAMRARLGETAAPARIQDPFGLRALPQVHGPALDRLAELDQVVGLMSAAPAENPVLLPEAGVAHHGGFHAAYLAQALDATVSAVAQSAQLGTARLALLIEPAFTGLAPFLGDGRPGASGVMGCEYVAAAALGTLRALATPASLQSVTISRGVEEDASFASLAARQALDAVQPYRVVLAAELLAAVRALRMRGRAVPDAVAALPAETADRDLSADLARAGELLERLAD